MGQNILLVNPNTMKTPPVIPIGLEYLATALEKHNHNVDILDLCFVSSPIKELEKAFDKETYDMVGFTIRNIDTCHYFYNEFYLQDFKKLIDFIKKQEIPIILGGAGFSAMPNEVLEYLQADFGIIGPGDIVLPKFLELWQKDKITTKIFDGWRDGIDNTLVHKRGAKINFQQYISNDGIVGFSTHVGCLNQCPYCVEANTKLSYKKIEKIIEELEFLTDQGYSHFHLCDSEFNSNLEFCIEFCKTLANKSLPLKWALYMKPSPYNEKLFELLHKSNAYLITLVVDSDNITQDLNNYSYEDLANIIGYCKKYNIDLAIDLLTGYPYETIESSKEIIEFFKKNRPKTVGVNSHYRVYKNTPLERTIIKDPALKENLNRAFSKEENFLKPIFFSKYEQQDIEDLTAGDELFHIAGVKPGVNYQL
jgi:radical SAM superfamily enzyme YgiQ (UPF0313 family)